MLSRQAGNTAATFKVGMMIENIGAAMATFFVLAAVKPAYRFVCTIFDPGDLRGPLVPGLVPGLAKRFQSIVLAEKMPSACNIRPLFASMKQGSNPVNVKPKEYTRSRASGMSMPPSYNGRKDSSSCMPTQWSSMVDLPPASTCFSKP